MRHRVFAIGAAGKWFSDTYAPVLCANSDRFNLIGVADINGKMDISKYGRDVTQIELSGNEEEDLTVISDKFVTLKPDIVIISSDPVSHFGYANAAISAGADVICDKPPIALQNQLKNVGSAGIEIRRRYYDLVRSLASSSHRSYPARRCNYFIPLRRRTHYPYGNMLKWIREVEKGYGVSPTNIDISFNDGSFRTHGEYDRPGVHGYRSGLGVVTHTGYHFLDFAAACVASEYSTIRNVACTRLESHCTFSDEKHVEKAFRSMLVSGNPLSPSFLEQHRVAERTLVAEADARVSYSISHATLQHARVYISILHRGCTRRETPFYSSDTTHDEARVDDVVAMIHQGPFQSIQLAITDNSGGLQPHGHCYLVRRTHPKIARELGVEQVVVLATDLIPGDAAAAYKRIVESFLEACASTLVLDCSHPLYTFSLENQALTTDLYAGYFD